MAKKNKSDKKRRKEKARHKAFQERKAVLKIMRDHNKVQYRKIPGLPGMYPYQLAPITYGEALTKLKTGILPVRKGVNNKMTDAQKQRLADLQALEILAEEEKPVLEALVALEAAEKALEEAKQANPVAVAQEAFDKAQAAYNDAEAAFTATQGGASTPSGDATPTDAGQATPSDAGQSATPSDATPSDATPSDQPSGEQPQS